MTPIQRSSSEQSSLTEKSSSAEQKKFTVNGFDYAAQLWSQDWSQESECENDQLPAIALHGW
jgi:hypothetical protein